MVGFDSTVESPVAWTSWARCPDSFSALQRRLRSSAVQRFILRQGQRRSWIVPFEDLCVSAYIWPSLRASRSLALSDLEHLERDRFLSAVTRGKPFAKEPELNARRWGVRCRAMNHLLAAEINSTFVAGENLTVGSTVWLPAESVAPGR